jgi:hypothetical protein
MPVFDFGDWPQVTTAVPGYRILAMMYYPKNPLRREELYTTLAAGYVLREAEDFSAWLRPPTARDLFPLLKARHEGRDYTAVIRAMQLKQHQGTIAGEVLFLIRCITAHGSQGSVLKACYIQAELAKRAKDTGETAVTLGMTRIKYTNAQALMEKAWTPYKDVAHFWTAHNLMVNTNMQRDVEGTLLMPGVRWFDAADAFREFLAIAESFRQFGENHIPPPADQPILNPSTTWRVPAYVQLPAFDPYDPHPLSQETKEALENYRA